MRRLLITLHAGGIHVDVENAHATAHTKTVQWPDKNFTARGDFNNVAELSEFIQEQQREVGAAQAVSQITALEPEPPRAA